MKPLLRDYLIILMAFLTVFICGLGAGKLIGQKHQAALPANAPAWETHALDLLVESLELSAAERNLADIEIQSAAGAISRTRDQTIVTYHEHLSALYQRLIDRLGDSHAARLQKEKAALDAKIRTLRQTT